MGDGTEPTGAEYMLGLFDAAMADVYSAAKDVFEEFNARHYPTLKQSEEIGPYWSPKAGMMETATMMRLGQALARMRRA
jgi:hypothetical protein